MTRTRRPGPGGVPGSPGVVEAPDPGTDAVRNRLAIVVAFVGPAAVAAAMSLVRTDVANTSLALVMVAVVVATAAPGRRLVSVVGGISAGIWFAFFLTRPYDSFSVERGLDVQTTVLLVLVAVAVGEIAARNRRHRSETVAARADLTVIGAVTEMLAQGAPVDQVVLAVGYELKALLSLDTIRFDARSRDRPLPYVERSGTISYNTFHWDTTQAGLPAKEVTLMVEAPGRCFGRYVLQGPSEGVPIPGERMVTAVALADLAGAALAASQSMPAPGGSDWTAKDYGLDDRW